MCPIYLSVVDTFLTFINTLDAPLPYICTIRLEVGSLRLKDWQWIETKHETMKLVQNIVIIVFLLLIASISIMLITAYLKVH